MASKEVERYIGLLDSGDESVVLDAIKNLESSSSADAIPALLKALGHQNKKVVGQVIKSLAAISRKNFIDGFDDLSPNMKKIIGSILAKLDKDVIKNFKDGLSSMNMGQKLSVIKKLQYLGNNEEVKEILVEMLSDRSEKVRAAIVSALGLVGDDNLIRRLTSVLNDSDSRVRANVVEALEKVGDTSNIRWILLRYVNDPNNRVRANVLKALWKIGYKNIKKPLEDMLKSPNEWMRASAVWAVGEMGDESQIDRLEIALRDKSENVRYNAVKAIGKFVDKEEVKMMISSMITDPSAKVREIVMGLVSV